MRLRTGSTGAIVGIILALAARTSPAGEELVFGVHPFMPAEKVFEAFSPLTEYVSDVVERPVRLEIAKNYQAHIEAVGNNERDIAYLGPVPYIRVVDGHGAKSILAQLEVNGKTTFRGAIVVRRESPLKSLADLTGKRFAFGDESSTMSHLVPWFMLSSAGAPKTKLAGFEHLPNHEAVGLAVLSGMFDAGAIKESIFRKHEKRGLRVLTWTVPIANHVLVARSDLPEAIQRMLRTALLRLDTSADGLNILRAIKPSITALVPGDDGDFDSLRTVLASLRING